MRYRILCDGELIGTTDLEDRDPELGVAAGRFVPTAAYARVRPVFRLFIAARADGESEPDAAKLEAYEAERAKLQLSIEDASGARLPGSGIVVLDYSDDARPDDPDAVEVEVYFTTPRQFAALRT